MTVRSKNSADQLTAKNMPFGIQKRKKKGTGKDLLPKEKEGGIKGVRESAGLNRFGIGNERVLQRGSSGNLVADIGHHLQLAAIEQDS